MGGYVKTGKERGRGSKRCSRRTFGKGYHILPGRGMTTKKKGDGRERLRVNTHRGGLESLCFDIPTRQRGCWWTHTKNKSPGSSASLGEKKKESGQRNSWRG